MSVKSGIGKSLQSTARSSIIVFMGMVLSITLWFITKIYIVRHVTKEELGVYSLVVAISGILSVLASLGIQEGVSRFLSMLLGEGKNDEADSMSNAAVKLGAVSGIFFSLLLFLASDLIAGSFFYKPEIAVPLRVMAFTIPCSVMISIMGGILRGHNLIAPRVYILDIGQPLFFLALLFLFFYIKLPFISVLYAFLAAIVLVFLLVGGFSLKKIGVRPLLLTGGKYGKKLVKFSLPLLVATILGIVLTWCDTIMLGRYTSAEEVGVYNVSISLAKLLTFPLAAMEFVYMPIAAGLYVQKQHAELRKTYQILTKWIFSATLPIFFVMFFFSEMTITVFFSERFISASAPLRILSVGFLFHAFLGANVVLLIIMGKSRDIMNISIFGTLLNILLNYILIKQLGYGIVGSATATLVSYFAINIITSLLLYRVSAIHPLTMQYLKPIVSSSLIGLIIYAIAKTLPLYLWMMPIYLILYLGGYFVSLITTKSFEREDIEMIGAILEKTGIETDVIKKFFDKFAHQPSQTPPS